MWEKVSKEQIRFKRKRERGRTVTSTLSTQARRKSEERWGRLRRRSRSSQRTSPGFLEKELPKRISILRGVLIGWNPGSESGGGDL